MKPLVSVVITSYNYSEYICTAIDSVLGQDYDNLEVVVTDNGSTDDTLEVLERYIDDGRVRVNVNAENLGITGNINVGIGLARGEYVTILSADDWLMPGHVSRLVATLERYPQIGFVYSGAFFFRGDAAVPFSVRHVLGQTLVPYVDRDEFGWLLAACYMCLPTIMFRRSLFEQYGLLDPTLRVASDWEITLRFVKAGVQTAYVPVPLVGVRFHDRQASGSGYFRSGEEFLEHLMLVERYLEDESTRHHGRETRILEALGGRFKMFKDMAPENVKPEFETRLDEVRTRLRASRTHRSTASSPKVSIIVTSTGRFLSLGACLKSIAEQTYKNWEVWLLQDVGFDASAFAETHIPSERLHCSRTLDRFGPALLRSTGFMLASGDYFIFIDEDTQLAPRHLQELVAAAQGEDGVAVAGTIVQFDQFEDPFNWHPLGNTDGTYPIFPTAEDLLVANCVPISALLFDASVVDELAELDQGLGPCSDWEFIIRVSRARRLAYTGTRTLIEHCFLGLRSQALQLQWNNYAPCLDLLYQRYTAPNIDILQARAKHRIAVMKLLNAGPVGYTELEKIFALYNGLAGAEVLKGAGAAV